MPLPAAQFSGVTTAVTFRIYTYWTTGLATFLDYDDIQLIGSYTPPNKRPQVGVFSAKKVTTTKSSIRLTGTAFDDSGVTQVQVGKRIAKGTTNWKAKVALKPGTNKIRIIATDTAGAVSAPLTVRVIRTGG